MITFLLIYTAYILIYNLFMFFVTKSYGVQIEKFYIWYDWHFRIFKFKVGGTEFGLGWIPVGGYIKPKGMILEPDEELKPYYFNAASPFKRILMLASGPLSSLIIGVSVYVSVLPELPQNFILFTVGLIASILLVLWGFVQLSKSGKKDQSVGVNLKAYLSTLIFQGIILFLTGYYIYLFTPFFEQVAAIWNGEVLFVFERLTSDDWISVVAFVGVWNFCSNILPIGGLNGATIISILYEIMAGEELKSKPIDYFRMLTGLLFFSGLIYFIYQLLFRV